MNGPNGRAPASCGLPEAVDQVRGRGALRERDEHEGDRGPGQRRPERAQAAPAEHGTRRPERQARAQRRQPAVDCRQAVERQRQKGGLGPAKTGGTDEREPVRRQDRDEERGERQELHGNRGEERDQREIHCAQGTIAGERRTDPPCEQRRAEGEADGAPEIDAAEEAGCRYQQQEERDDRPAITRRRSSARARCRSSSCSGSRSSASSNTCSGSRPRGSARRQ